MSNEGIIYRVAGPVVTATGISPRMYDVVQVGNEKLMGEVIKIVRDKTIIQVYENTSGIKPGEPVVLKEGSDVTVFACGVMVLKALEAAKALEGKISVRVVNVPSIKPMNREAIAALAKDVKGVVTAEEHSVIGGLGGAIAEALRLERTPIEFVGVEDRFGESAHNYDDILNYLGLTAAHIQEAVEKIYNL